MMEGAVWRDPDRVDEWMGELSKTAPVVAFCVYGFHVGCQTVATLRKAGFDARYMAGGHFAWKAIKGPVRLFESTTPLMSLNEPAALVACANAKSEK
jgi:Fe-Mn family superoxide dismutase